MAITDIYNSLTFGGINSLDYGVYISGPAVYNAPTRDVELVSVPGRNGAIEIDKGHWNNIEVTYKAGTFGDDQSDFATKINAFRNAIVSQIGYQRITDTYNPEEYRLGIYLSGLSVNAVNRNAAGEFDLVFNCKPQRYLIDGETPIQVSSGDTITNPTLYDAGPLLAVEGVGNLNVNGYEIDIEDIPIGEISVLSNFVSRTMRQRREPSPATLEQASLLNVGDKITLNGTNVRIFYSHKQLFTTTILAVNILDAGDFTNIDVSINRDRSGFSIEAKLEFPIELQYRTQETSYSTSITVQVVFSDSTSGDVTIGLELYCTTVLQIYTTGPDPTNRQWNLNRLVRIPEAIGDSTQSALGHPTYIDCEIGDAYKIENDEVVDLNSAIALGSDLPKLNPGENDVTLDDTITSLEITPRWWEL